MSVSAVQPSPTEDLRAAAWMALVALERELVTLQATLEPTRRVSDLRVITEAEHQRIDAMTRREKHDRLESLQAHGGVESTGHVVSPARMRSLDALTEAHSTLTVLERRLFRTARVCPLDKPPDNRPTVDICRRIRHWLPQAHTAELLAAICEDTDRLVETVKRAIDGEKTTRLNAPCPYCDRNTLVVYHEQGFIRCDRPLGGECLCGSSDCGCTKGRRHKWQRARGQWDILARMLERRTS